MPGVVFCLLSSDCQFAESWHRTNVSTCGRAALTLSQAQSRKPSSNSTNQLSWPSREIWYGYDGFPSR